MIFPHKNLCKHTHLISMLRCINHPFEESVSDETENFQQEQLDVEHLGTFGQDCEIVIEREVSTKINSL